MYLPTEILSAILSHHPKTELNTARLVCKDFDAAATPILFKEIFLIARYAEMEKASLLASRFGSYVKTLILSSEYFPSPMPWQTFEKNFPDRKLVQSYSMSYFELAYVLLRACI